MCAKQEEEVITSAIGIKPGPANRDNVKITRPKLYQVLAAVVGIFTYTGAYFIDAKVLQEYYSNSHLLWFLLTLISLVIPTIVVNVLSLKLFYDDARWLKYRTIIMHLLCLGPIERYCIVVYNGFLARTKIKNKTSEPDHVNYYNYLENWRDVSMLRFFYAFLETGPQVTIQLYILLDIVLDAGNVGVVKEHGYTITLIILTFAGLSFGIAGYNADLRETEGRGLTPAGLFFQTIYRFSMITSRIATLVLFVRVISWYVSIVIIPTWLFMFLQVQRSASVFFTKENGCCNNLLEIVFQLVMGYIYMFCYVATDDGSQRKPMTIYYIFFYLENIGMMVAWIVLNKRNFDSFEMGAILFVFCLMLLGIVFLLVYYKCFHPTLKRSNDPFKEAKIFFARTRQARPQEQEQELQEQQEQQLQVEEEEELKNLVS